MPAPCHLQQRLQFYGLGNNARGYEPRLENAYKVEDAVSYTRGPHIFKFGVEYRDSSLAGGAEVTRRVRLILVPTAPTRQA